MGCADRFLVVVHDVAVPFAPQLREIRRALGPLVGRALAAAVVPRWHGAPPPAHDGPFVALVRDAFGELLLHGLTHRSARPWGPLAGATGGANELSGLSAPEALARLRRGQADLAALFGASACGFVPPAWQYGPLTPPLLAACGLGYGLGFRRLVWAAAADGRAAAPFQLLAVSSWDWGRIGALGPLGAALGPIRLAALPGALPCVVIHPADVARGHLPAAAYLVRRLLASGRRPMLPGSVLPSGTV